MTSSKPNYFPKAPPPNTITLGVRTSTWETGGDADIRPLTACQKVRRVLPDQKAFPAQAAHISM